MSPFGSPCPRAPDSGRSPTRWWRGTSYGTPSSFGSMPGFAAMTAACERARTPCSRGRVERPARRPRGRTGGDTTGDDPGGMDAAADRGSPGCLHRGRCRRRHGAPEHRRRGRTVRGTGSGARRVPLSRHLPVRTRGRSRGGGAGHGEPVPPSSGPRSARPGPKSSACRSANHDPGLHRPGRGAPRVGDAPDLGRLPQPAPHRVPAAGRPHRPVRPRRAEESASLPRHRCRGRQPLQHLHECRPSPRPHRGSRRGGPRGHPLARGFGLPLLRGPPRREPHLHPDPGGAQPGTGGGSPPVGRPGAEPGGGGPPDVHGPEPRSPTPADGPHRSPGHRAAIAGGRGGSGAPGGGHGHPAPRQGGRHP
jgi:hypothetical protein